MTVIIYLNIQDIRDYVTERSQVLDKGDRKELHRIKQRK